MVMPLGLRAIHEAGYVHRDISTGNILIVEGVAKIVDLEYAKRKDEITHHTIRTVRRDDSSMVNILPN